MNKQQIGLPKFIQITAAHGKLYALDADGDVWVYYPAQMKKYADTAKPKTRYAFWGRITSHRATS